MRILALAILLSAPKRTIHTSRYAYRLLAWRRQDRLFLHVTGAMQRIRVRSRGPMFDQSVFLRSRIASRLAAATDDNTAKSNCIGRTGYTQLGRSFSRRLANKVTLLPVLRPTHNPQTGGRRLRVFVTRPGASFR